MNWLMRKLPKRVLNVGDMYRPQVWLLWWHGVWEHVGYGAIAPLEYDKLEDAVWVLAHRWEREEPAKRTVVWRGR